MTTRSTSASSTAMGTELQAAVTGASGQVTFNLPETGALCLSATLTIDGIPTTNLVCRPQPFPKSVTIAF